MRTSHLFSGWVYRSSNRPGPLGREPRRLARGERQLGGPSFFRWRRESSTDARRVLRPDPQALRSPGGVGRIVPPAGSVVGALRSSRCRPAFFPCAGAAVSASWPGSVRRISGTPPGVHSLQPSARVGRRRPRRHASARVGGPFLTAMQPRWRAWPSSGKACARLRGGSLSERRRQWARLGAGFVHCVRFVRI